MQAPLAQLVQTGGDIGDQRLEDFRVAEGLVESLLEINRLDLVEVLQHEVVVVQQFAQLDREAPGLNRSPMRKPRRATLSSYAGPIPRPVVPILPSERDASRAWSSATW